MKIDWEKSQRISQAGQRARAAPPPLIIIIIMIKVIFSTFVATQSLNTQPKIKHKKCLIVLI